MKKRLRVGMLAGAFIIAFATGCASTTRPALCPNAHYQKVGATVAERDIDACRQYAENFGVSKTDASKVGRGSAEAAIGASADAGCARTAECYGWRL